MSSPHVAIGADEEARMDSLHPVETNNVRPACFNSTLQEVLFVLTATMAIAMGAFVIGSVVVTSSFIGRDLNMSTAEITWIGSANALSSGAFLLFFGKVADCFGQYGRSYLQRLAWLTVRRPKDVVRRLSICLRGLRTRRRLFPKRNYYRCPQWHDGLDQRQQCASRPWSSGSYIREA